MKRKSNFSGRLAGPITCACFGLHMHAYTCIHVQGWQKNTQLDRDCAVWCQTLHSGRTDGCEFRAYGWPYIPGVREVIPGVRMAGHSGRADGNSFRAYGWPYIPGVRLLLLPGLTVYFLSFLYISSIWG
jgi:hypothetical protein